MNGMMALLAGGATVVSVIVALVLEFALLQLILGAVAKAKLEDESPVARCQSPVASRQSPVASSNFQLPKAPMPNWNNPVSPTETIPALARVARERM